MKTKFLFLVSAAFVMLLVSCSEEGVYPKMYESMMIQNQSVDTLLVEIASNQLYAKDTTVKIFPKSDFYWYIDEDSYELWLTEAQLVNYFSELNMWFITPNDTLSVNKNQYSKMTDWNHYLHTDNWFGTVTYFNSHTLTIGN